MQKTVLNVGGGSKHIPLPEPFNGYQHIMLDIDPGTNPDVCMDARDLINHDKKYDAVYSSHNLEHFRHYDVYKVLSGMHHVLKDTGFMLLVVPDVKGVIEWMVENKLDLDAVVYEVPRGPVTVRDMIWGHAGNIRVTPDEWFLHKTGFSKRLLTHALYDAGFKSMVVKNNGKEIVVLAFKEEQTTVPEISI